MAAAYRWNFAPVFENADVLWAGAIGTLRLFAICVVFAGLVTLAAALLGHPMVGVFFGIGLGLGLLNAILVQRSVESITAAIAVASTVSVLTVRPNQCASV